jgi:hypothetical protein
MVRKHKGIIQKGGNKGKLKKGYKYIGKKLKNGLPKIIKVQKEQKGGRKKSKSKKSKRKCRHFSGYGERWKQQHPYSGEVGQETKDESGSKISQARKIK